MIENLKDYMTEEEKRQIDALLDRAEERRRRKQADSNKQRFLFLKCQCECYEGMMQQNQEEQKKMDAEEAIQKMLRQICDFCRKHRACYWEGGMEREGEVDEDLPF